MSAAEIAVLAAMALSVVATHLGAGWLVLRRVREHWGGPHRVLGVVVVMAWPVVVLGIEVGWLLGLNDWHLRPDR